MELTKRILNLSLAFCVVTLSVSVFIYPVRDNKAHAAPQADAEGYIPVGITKRVYTRGYDTEVIGYNPNSKDVKVLAHKYLGGTKED